MNNEKNKKKVIRAYRRATIASWANIMTLGAFPLTTSVSLALLFRACYKADEETSMWFDENVDGAWDNCLKFNGEEAWKHCKELLGLK